MHVDKRFMQLSPFIKDMRIISEGGEGFDDTFTSYLPFHVIASSHWVVGGGHNGEDVFICPDCGTLELYDLIYIYDGSITLHRGGVQFSADSGKAVFINCGTGYTIASASGSPDVFIIRSQGYLCASFFKLIIGNRLHYIPPSDRLHFEELLNGVSRYLEYPSNMNNALLTSAATQLYTELYAGEKGITKSGIYGQPQWFCDTVDYIEHNIRHNIDINELAGIAGFSRTRFFTVFRDYTGSTPYAYVNSLRLKRAKSLLLNTETQIKTIALDLGFSSVGHFIERFRKETGMTPLEYRAKCK